MLVVLDRPGCGIAVIYSLMVDNTCSRCCDDGDCLEHRVVVEEKQ